MQGPKPSLPKIGIHHCLENCKHEKGGKTQNILSEDFKGAKPARGGFISQGLPTRVFHPSQV